jgi:hypothetical protein
MTSQADRLTRVWPLSRPANQSNAQNADVPLPVNPSSCCPKGQIRPRCLLPGREGVDSAAWLPGEDLAHLLSLFEGTVTGSRKAFGFLPWARRYAVRWFSLGMVLPAPTSASAARDRTLFPFFLMSRLGWALVIGFFTCRTREGHTLWMPARPPLAQGKLSGLISCSGFSILTGGLIDRWGRGRRKPEYRVMAPRRLRMGSEQK